MVDDYQLEIIEQQKLIENLKKRLLEQEQSSKSMQSRLILKESELIKVTHENTGLRTKYTQMEQDLSSQKLAYDELEGSLTQLKDSFCQMKEREQTKGANMSQIPPIYESTFANSISFEFSPTKGLNQSQGISPEKLGTKVKLEEKEHELGEILDRHSALTDSLNLESTQQDPEKKANVEREIQEVTMLIMRV